MADGKLMQRCYSIWQRQKTKLEYLSKTLKKSESELIREAIDAKFPDAIDLPVNLRQLHNTYKAAKVEISEDDFKSLYQGNSQAFWDKITRK